MEKVNCPYCKEEIQPKAIICKHCHERIYATKADLIMHMVMEKVRFAIGPIASGISKPDVSACGAFCYFKFGNDKPRLNECLNGCKEAEAIAEVAERLHRELIITMADIIWGGGDIDPIPFERAVRERFKRPDK